MTINEMYNKAMEIEENALYGWVGIRFENKDRVVGESIDNSRDNPDRDDERDFPEYGTEEYNDLPEVDGACAYMIKGGRGWKTGFRGDETAEVMFEQAHCYIIAGDAGSYGADEGEEIIRDAIVIEKMF